MPLIWNLKCHERHLSFMKWTPAINIFFNIFNPVIGLHTLILRATQEVLVD